MRQDTVAAKEKWRCDNCETVHSGGQPAQCRECGCPILGLMAETPAIQTKTPE